MSTLSVSNISDGTDTVETGYVVNGSAKAWVNFNARNTAVIRDSLNVGSMVDNGTGQHTINFSSTMSNSSYSVTNSVNGNNVVSGAMTEITAYTASSYLVRGINPQSGYANADFETQSCATHGDLA